MTFYPDPPPADAASLAGWARAQFEKVAGAFRPQKVFQLETSHAEPAKPREGMIVLADGSDWDPGSGAGFYGYYGGAWVKLG